MSRPHTGKIVMPGSNQRWCSDEFNIKCWNGEAVQGAFSLDCHDREALGFVGAARALNDSDVRLLLDRSNWTRFGEAALKTPV